LTHSAKQHQLIKGKRIAFDFRMGDFTGDDVELKNIGKGPSLKRKICFPGFRPHLPGMWIPGPLFLLNFEMARPEHLLQSRELSGLIQQSLGNHSVEHLYLDSEYTAEHVWKFIVAPDKGLGNMGILEEYRIRWTIENGIKDLVANYFFNNIPGVDPHRINIHYFVVTLARILYYIYEMLCQDYEQSRNLDRRKKQWIHYDQSL